jgi:hypothetical protein
MADNVGYTPGVGATVAADEIGGVLHQRVKISIGADGAAADLSSANPMPMLAQSLPLPAGAATEATAAALLARVPAAVTPTVASVASSATSVTIAAANANRKRLTVMNDSTAKLRVGYTAGVTLANASYVVAANSLLVLSGDLNYAGALYGVWETANGRAQVTEFA